MADSKETQALRKDLEQLRKDFAALRDSAQRSSEAQFQAGVDSAREHFDQWQQEAGRRVEDLGAEIKARPFTSILAAFGVGMLLGKTFGR